MRPPSPSQVRNDPSRSRSRSRRQDVVRLVGVFLEVVLDGGHAGIAPVVVQDLLYLPRRAGDDLPDAAQLLPVQPSLVQLAPEEPAEAHDLVLYLVDLAPDLGIPAPAEPAPDVLHGAAILLEELAPGVRDLIDLLAVALGG